MARTIVINPEVTIVEVTINDGAPVSVQLLSNSISVALNGDVKGRFNTINFKEGANVAIDVTEDGKTADVEIASSGLGGSAIQFQDEGVNLGNNQADTVNFIGGGVSATRAGDVVTVSVPGGGAGVQSVNGPSVNNSDPENPVIQSASQTQEGTVELATASESRDETLGNKAITPKSLRETGGGLGLPPARTLTDDDSLILSDLNKLVVFNISSNKTCTIPAGVFGQGDIVYIERRGSGILTLAAGTGMTLVSSLGALTDAGENNIFPLLFQSASTCSIFNGIPGTGVPSSRTIAGLDLTTNRSASELMIAMGVIMSNILRGSSNNRFHGSSLVTGATSLNTATLPVNSLRASPFIVGRELTLDRIQAEVTTLGTSAKLRLGVYADNNGYPGALLVDSGELDAGSTGVKTATINLTIQPGLYWLACLGGTASAIYRAEGATCFWPSVNGYDSAMGGTIRQPYWVVAQPYGALPDPFTASGSINNTGTNIPIILVRA